MQEYFTLANLDYRIIIAYLISVVLIGFFASKIASKNINEYFLGDKKIPWWMLGLSGAASNIDMTGTMVITSFIFAVGMQGFWVSMRGGIGLPLGILMIYMGKWLARSDVMTTAEWMEFRFGSGKSGQAARILSAVSNLVVVIGMIIYFAVGTGKFLSMFLPCSPEVCSIIMVTVGILYTTLSGLYGVVFTDILQEIIIIISAFYISFKAFFLSNHAEVISYAGKDWLNIMPKWHMQPMEWLHNPEIYSLFGVCIMFWILRGVFEGMGGFAGGYLAQRFYATKNGKSASLLTLEWIFFLAIRWTMITAFAVLGLSLCLHNPEISGFLHADPEKTMPLVLGMILPVGIKGLVFVGLIAAAMSTFDSTLNAGASYWVRDIYQKYLNKSATEKQLVKQSYLASVFIGVIGVVIAFQISNINEIWNWITGALSAGLFAPIVLRWYWGRFNGIGFAVSTAAGLLAAILLNLFLPNLPFYIGFIIIWLISLASGIIASLLTPPVEQKVLENFYKKIKPFGFWGDTANKCEISFAEKVKSENSLVVYNTILAVICHLSLFLSAIVLILKQWNILACSFSSFLISAVILYFTWYKKLETE